MCLLPPPKGLSRASAVADDGTSATPPRVKQAKITDALRTRDFIAISLSTSRATRVSYPLSTIPLNLRRGESTLRSATDGRAHTGSHRRTDIDRYAQRVQRLGAVGPGAPRPWLHDPATCLHPPTARPARRHRQNSDPSCRPSER